MPLTVTEVGHAATSYPILFTKHQQTEEFNICGLFSVEPQDNLFVRDDIWLGLYQPLCMQTHPLYLMKDPDNDKGYTVGFEPKSSDIGSDKVHAVFADDGKASELLESKTQLLQESLKNSVHTFQFFKKMEELKLLKPINLNIHYAETGVQSVAGLHTIDEDALYSLNAEQVHELHNNGYLGVIHACLISMLQLNRIVHQHNKTEGKKLILQIKLEAPKASAE